MSEEKTDTELLEKGKEALKEAKEKNLFQSKKFWSAVIGAVLTPAAGILSSWFGCEPEAVMTIIVMVAGIFGVQINAQGSADKAAAIKK